MTNIVTMVVAKFVPHLTGVIGAVGTAATASTNGSNTIEVALIGGGFLLANTILTVVLNRIFAKRDTARKKSVHHKKSGNRSDIVSGDRFRRNLHSSTSESDRDKSS